MRDLIAEAAARGQAVCLEALVVDTPAHSLYARLGFRETGRDDLTVRTSIEVYR